MYSVCLVVVLLMVRSSLAGKWQVVLTTASFYIIHTSSYTATVLHNPVDTSREPGEWAEFTCSVACSHSIDWYVEGYSGDITSTCSAQSNGMMVCRVVTQSCSSTTSTFGYTETLRVLAKPELASSNIAVQCAAVSRSSLSSNNCPPFLAYSRYALLSGKPLN